MDLRWHMNHVTSTIARAFGLSTPAQDAEAQIWLFHAAPGSSCEEPLNKNNMHTEPTTLKELQRTTYLPSTTTASRRPTPLALHAVELPFANSREVFERGLCPLCVRFFDTAVHEVGS